MKLAVMQPYFFPYVGYFQLLDSVDRFVFFDDVAFSRSGYVHRNRLAIGGSAWTFTIPVRSVSRGTTIANTSIAREEFGRFRTKMLRTLDERFHDAPGFDRTRRIVDSVLSTDSDFVADLAKASVSLVSAELGIDTTIIPTSSDISNDGLRGADRILDICARTNATYYVNLPGGRKLYERSRFADHAIDLRFLEPRLGPYERGNEPFVPSLSILDLLLWSKDREARRWIEGYRLVT